MARQLNTVTKGQPLTAEAWNALVDRVNLLDRQSFDFTVPPKNKGKKGGSGDCSIVAGEGISVAVNLNNEYTISNKGVLRVGTYVSTGAPGNITHTEFILQNQEKYLYFESKWFSARTRNAGEAFITPNVAAIRGKIQVGIANDDNGVYLYFAMVDL